MKIQIKNVVYAVIISLLVTCILSVSCVPVVAEASDTHVIITVSAYEALSACVALRAYSPKGVPPQVVASIRLTYIQLFPQDCAMQEANVRYEVESYLILNPIED